MKAHKIFYPFVALAIIGATSCDQDDPTTHTAGKYGQTKLQVVPRHHGKPIDQGKVYIKYNTLELPGSYDDSARIIVKEGTPIATFDHLQKGNYFVYGVGYDQDIAETVTGGSPVILSETGTTVTHNLAVSEEHGSGN